MPALPNRMDESRSTMPLVLPHPMMTVKQVAKELQVTASTIYSYVRENRLHAARLPGGDYRIRRSDLDAFVESLYGAMESQLALDAQARVMSTHTRENARAMSLFERGREVASDSFK